MASYITLLYPSYVMCSSLLIVLCWSIIYDSPFGIAVCDIMLDHCVILCCVLVSLISVGWLMLLISIFITMPCVMCCQSKIEEDTPFGRVARPFFCGSDDEFRNNRFKLIPKVRLRTAVAVTRPLPYSTLLDYTLPCVIVLCVKIWRLRSRL